MVSNLLKRLKLRDLGWLAYDHIVKGRSTMVRSRPFVFQTLTFCFFCDVPSLTKLYDPKKMLLINNKTALIYLCYGSDL